MKIKIVFLFVPEFEKDVALYQVSERELRQMKDNLRSNPLLGKPLSGEPGLRVYAMENYEYVYSVSGDFRKIMLLQVEPTFNKPLAPNDTIRDYAKRLGKLILKTLVKRWLS